VIKYSIADLEYIMSQERGNCCSECKLGRAVPVNQYIGIDEGQEELPAIHTEWDCKYCWHHNHHLRML
jgi:hypothetical protein